MHPVLALDHLTLPFWERCQSNGVPIDRPGCLAFADELESRFSAILEEIHGDLGYYLNPNSDDQVREMLLERLPAEMKDAKKTRGGEVSTGKKVVENLRGLDPVVDKVIDGRQVTKVRSSFALPLGLEIDPPLPAEPHRARSNLRVTRTASGRPSATVDDERGGASMLTLPTRSPLGRRIRKLCKIAAQHRNCPSQRVLLARDLSQIEFRVVAHLSGDKTMCQVFHDGLDLHKKTASAIFGKPIDELDKLTERDPAKSAGFGILFGITAEGFRDQMRVMGVGDQWPLDRCEQLLEDWFDVYPGVRRFISETRAECARQGYVSDMSGRRRYLPGAASKLSWIREEAWRQAVSLKVQGGAQAILKEAIIQLWPVLVQHWRTAPQYVEPLLEIHDELLFEAEETEVEWVMALLNAAMTTTTQLRVPITSSGGFATDWGSLEK